MILHPFGFFARSGAIPEIVSAAVIAFVSDNTFGYTPSMWDQAVVSSSVQWFTNGIGTGISTATYVAALGASVYLVETVEFAIGDDTSQSNTIAVPDLLTNPVITQSVAETVVYTTAGTWSGDVTVVTTFWTINGVVTNVPAIVGFSTDLTSIGARRDDAITVSEYANGSYAVGNSNVISYLTFAQFITEEAALNYAVAGNMSDTVLSITEEAALNYDVSGTLSDRTYKTTEQASMIYTLTGSIT